MADTLNLPHNYEAECNVLGSCLLSSSSAAIVAASCDDGCFVDERNQLVFKAIKDLLNRGELIDATTVNNELLNLKLNEQVGGIDYLLQLSDSVLNLENLDHYIKIVKDQSVLRRLLYTVRDVENEYKSGVANINDFVSSVTSRLNEISNSRQVGEFKTTKEVTDMVQYNLKQLAANDNKELIGVDTGYKKLNQMTHGWRKGDLIIVAARPSMGKTALTLNLAYNAAYRTGKPVVFFSLEMDNVGVMNRIIANRAMVSNDHIQTGKLSNSEKVKVANAIEEISSVPLYFDDTPNGLLGDMIAKATKLKSQHPDLSMVVIDYLGKITTTKSGKVESREREVSLCTNQLKQMARELQVPVILVCQINRNAENNEGKKPSMANLRESGSIEADADQVILLYREDYYTAVGQSVAKKKTFMKEGQQVPVPAPTPNKKPGEDDNSVMDVILAKSRNGKVGTIKLLFSKQYSRFDDLSDEFEEIIAQHERAMGNSGDFLE